MVPSLLAPAVLISAAALLALGTYGRYGRIVDRIRAADGARRGGAPDEVRLLRPERDLFYLRARRAWLALVLLHSAVLSFVAASLILGRAGAAPALALAGPSKTVGTFLLFAGTALLGGASLALVSEATAAFETTKLETARTDHLLPR